MMLPSPEGAESFRQRAFISLLCFRSLPLLFLGNAPAARAESRRGILRGRGQGERQLFGLSALVQGRETN